MARREYYCYGRGKKTFQIQNFIKHLVQILQKVMVSRLEEAKPSIFLFCLPNMKHYFTRKINVFRHH